MKTVLRKEGSKWHGYIEGRPEVDETGLTYEVAKRKVESVAAQLASNGEKQNKSGSRR
jgi:hypothetical protein